MLNDYSFKDFKEKKTSQNIILSEISNNTLKYHIMYSEFIETSIKKFYAIKR